MVILHKYRFRENFIKAYRFDLPYPFSNPDVEKFKLLCWIFFDDALIAICKVPLSFLTIKYFYSKIIILEFSNRIRFLTFLGV